MDLFNGTPVLDIKPYYHSRVVREFTVPWWARVLVEIVRKALGEEAPI